MAIHEINDIQHIPASKEEIWDFISNPANLATITPPSMGFQIKNSDLPPKIYPGLMIRYRVKPLLGIPLTWLTEITQVKEGAYFVDEQRTGPYALWHHEHFIEATGDGVLMRDKVTYKLPLGFLGELAHVLFVRRKLRTIFLFRRDAVEKKFGSGGSRQHA